VAGSYENGNEILGSVEGVEFLDHLLKKEFAL
jgi:hypothetical protein